MEDTTNRYATEIWTMGRFFAALRMTSVYWNKQLLSKIVYRNKHKNGEYVQNGMHGTSAGKVNYP